MESESSHILRWASLGSRGLVHSNVRRLGRSTCRRDWCDQIFPHIYAGTTNALRLSAGMTAGIRAWFWSSSIPRWTFLLRDAGAEFRLSVRDGLLAENKSALVQWWTNRIGIAAWTQMNTSVQRCKRVTSPNER